MPDIDIEAIMEKAEAFAGLIIFVLGVVACYLAVAFIYFDLSPATWGWFGRTLCVGAIVAWCIGFTDAVAPEAPVADEE